MSVAPSVTLYSVTIFAVIKHSSLLDICNVWITLFSIMQTVYRCSHALCLRLLVALSLVSHECSCRRCALYTGTLWWESSARSLFSLLSGRAAHTEDVFYWIFLEAVARFFYILYSDKEALRGILFAFLMVLIGKWKKHWRDGDVGEMDNVIFLKHLSETW